MVFSCLSQDIIAHEMTHAIVHRLRRHFFVPTNRDVLAFHEGFADIIAIFQHFGFPAILRDTIQRTRGDFRQNTPLVDLAVQFGHATGRNAALRSAIDDPNPARFRTTWEAHERGAILVAAVFDSFFQTYQGRILDLIRIASGGTGRLPEGDLHPDLVNRIAAEATDTAQATLRMCIRAFDYLPPVDITFGDYLRAMVTADFELNPADPYGLRRNMIEAFRLRGIYPLGVDSLSEDSLRWPLYGGPPQPLRFLDGNLQDLGTFNEAIVYQAASTSRNAALDEDLRTPKGRVPDFDADPENLQKRFATLIGWANDNREPLRLVADAWIEIAGIHSSFRVAQDGQLLIETVTQFVQKDSTPQADLGGVLIRGGTTVIAKANGDVRYVIPKQLADSKWVARQKSYLAELDGRDAFQIWQDEKYQRDRILKRVTLSAVHRGAK
jgi:hypothetical protein